MAAVSALKVIFWGGQISVLCLAAFVLFRRAGNTLAEAAAYAPIAVFMGLSLLLQVFWLAGGLHLAVWALPVAGVAAAVVVVRLRASMGTSLKAVGAFMAGHPAASAGLVAGWTLLAVLALRGDKTSWLTSGAAPGPMIQALSSMKSPFAAATPGALWPQNVTILPLYFAAFGSTWAAGLIGWLSYVSIAFATYALARRYAWPPAAFTVVLVVVSMPRLVYHAASAGTEILPAATALICILALYRTVEQPNITDLLMLFLAILFVISGGTLCLVLPCVLLATAVLVLYRRHGAITWRFLVRQNIGAVLTAMLPALVFSQVLIFGTNVLHGKNWVGSEPGTALVFNADGLMGWAGNLVRYALQSIHLTLPVEHFFQWVFGFSWIGLLQGIYDHLLDPLFNHRGLAAPFVISWRPDAVHSWFGPLAVLLILPALGYALMRGPRRLKSVALALLVYVALIGLIAAWMPQNARFFTTFFVCAGFLTAFLLPPWRMTRRRRWTLQAVCILILLYSVSQLWGSYT